MTSQTPAQRFSDIAAGYAATMAPSLRSIAAEVVRRARLRPDERVLDLGTGTGIAAAAARGEGRVIVGVDAAPGMLEIARVEVPGVEFLEMDFSALTFDDEAFDVCLAAHSLLFAADQLAVLREWRRVTRPGGRLSFSVPGPREVSPVALYAEVFVRHGVDHPARALPTSESLAALADDAGWTHVETHSDPTTAILLPDDAAFRLWREIGSRGAATVQFTPEQDAALTADMRDVTPRDAGGGYRIPFGALFLTARR